MQLPWLFDEDTESSVSRELDEGYRMNDISMGISPFLRRPYGAEMQFLPLSPR